MANILVIDDKTNDREYLTSFLKHRDSKPHSASDGAEPLAIAKLNHPHLIAADAPIPVGAEPATAASPSSSPQGARPNPRRSGRRWPAACPA